MSDRRRFRVIQGGRVDLAAPTDGLTPMLNPNAITIRRSAIKICDLLFSKEVTIPRALTLPPQLNGVDYGEGYGASIQKSGAVRVTYNNAIANSLLTAAQERNRVTASNYLVAAHIAVALVYKNKSLEQAILAHTGRASDLWRMGGYLALRTAVPADAVQSVREACDSSLKTCLVNYQERWHEMHGNDEAPPDLPVLGVLAPMTPPEATGHFERAGLTLS